MTDAETLQAVRDLAEGWRFLAFSEPDHEAAPWWEMFAAEVLGVTEWAPET